MPVMRRGRRQGGIVLPLVLIIALMLSAAILTFVRRSVIDGMVIRNRNRAAAAEALARGGIQIGMGVVFIDRVQKYRNSSLNGGNLPGASEADLWSKIGPSVLKTKWGGRLRIEIADGEARLNLNALVPGGVEGPESQPEPEAEEFLIAFLERIIEQMDGERAQAYIPRDMARNLLDYIDTDDVAIGGQKENDYYTQQDPPYLAANRPLLSVEEVALVEGFDVEIMRAMRPYVGVHPLLGDIGIDLNTAPPHVLSLIYHGSSGDMRMADERIVRDIMRQRKEDKMICSETAADPKRCVSLADVGLGTGSIYPPVALPVDATVFTITAEATVGPVVRTVEAVVDISDEENPQLLSWRLRP